MRQAGLPKKIKKNGFLGDLGKNAFLGQKSKEPKRKCCKIMKKFRELVCKVNIWQKKFGERRIKIGGMRSFGIIWVKPRLFSNFIY